MVHCINQPWLAGLAGLGEIIFGPIGRVFRELGLRWLCVLLSLLLRLGLPFKLLLLAFESLRFGALPAFFFLPPFCSLGLRSLLGRLLVLLSRPFLRSPFGSPPTLRAWLAGRGLFSTQDQSCNCNRPALLGVAPARTPARATTSTRCIDIAFLVHIAIAFMLCIARFYCLHPVRLG